ncbi:MAG: M14 family zinc carboxypeptidase, partial [Longimicrobiales bacterium]
MPEQAVRPPQPLGATCAHLTALALVVCIAPLVVTPAAGQELPRTDPPAGCRSEMDARLAFGLCPDSAFDFYASGDYREGVPRPEQVLGYPIGSWHTTYGRMERFLVALSSAVPERVRVFDYGMSIERHTMHLVAIGSESSIGRLEAIRSGLALLADPRQTTAADADAIIADLPVVVWLNAANDGNETAAFEAVMQVAYQLAAGEDPRTQAMRQDALVLINLAHNPESHERMVAWYNAFVAGDPDPAAMEH